jgi:heat shock protein 4
MLTRS